jgi:transposase InsO family protein
MQVFGLPGQIIRNGRAASFRAGGAPLARGSAPSGRQSRRRPSFAPLSLGEAGCAEEPASSSRSAQDLDARAQAGGRAAAAGLPDVGTRQARSAVARARLRGERGHRWTRPGRPCRPRRRSAVAALRRRPYARRWTAKRRFAQRLPRPLVAGGPGGLVQLDTVFVNLTPTKAIKHFTAYDPIAKWTVGKAFNRATAQAAAAFLDKITADMPFPVRAIQVDGGSEFMAEFEAACQAKGIALSVLPPRSPQMNGAVERCNGAWRYEFYETYDLPASVNELNPILDSYQHLYNHHRPHGALAGMTPAQYLAGRSAQRPQPSHRP